MAQNDVLMSYTDLWRYFNRSTGEIQKSIWFELMKVQILDFVGTPHEQEVFGDAPGFLRQFIGLDKKEEKKAEPDEYVMQLARKVFLNKT